MKNSQNLLNIYAIKKKKFFLCIYKMFNIDKETYENNEIEAIVDDIGTLWLNEKNIEEKIGHKNLPAITNKTKHLKNVNMN